MYQLNNIMKLMLINDLAGEKLKQNFSAHMKTR